MNTKTKQTAKHTAGEWQVSGFSADSNSSDYYIQTERSGFTITNPHTRGMSFSEKEANARLIASAPKLLRGLELMTESYEYWMSKYQPEALNSQLVADVKKAIAKAKGE